MHESLRRRRALLAEVSPLGDQDVVGSRTRLVQVGIGAVFFACVTFTGIRLAAELTVGRATPWWGNAIGAVSMPLLYLWYRRSPNTRSGVAVHLTAAAATIALLIPAAYGIPSSKWWLSLVGFSVLLMGRRNEALTWTAITLALVPTVAYFEPQLALPGAVGESDLESGLAGLLFLVLLFVITLVFRRVADARARELRDMALSLERSNEVRSHFLAHMSHEIRTPLHGTIANTELALCNALPDEVREHVHAANDSAQVLLTLLNNILDVTRSEAGAIELDEHPFDLHETVTQALRAFSGRAQAKGLDLEAQAAPGLQRARIGDRTRVMQIVLNLVSNAFKFTERGDVRVRLEPGATPEDVTLIVQDTGRGIAADRLGHIFEPFTQEAADARFEDGAGLGLAITRALAGLMGGGVSVQSTLGEGSRFEARLRLPLDPETPGAGPTELRVDRASYVPPGIGPRANLRILLCEDNPTGRRALARMLHRLGHEVEALESGDQAWARLQRETFDLLITDVEMPGMDGFELVRNMRRRERTEGLAEMPVIAATAHVGAEDANRLLEVGATAHLPKPFTMESLRNAISQCVASPASVPVGPSEAEMEPTEG